jgi:hypothetical protein
MPRFGQTFSSRSCRKTTSFGSTARTVRARCQVYVWLGIHLYYQWSRRSPLHEGRAAWDPWLWYIRQSSEFAEHMRYDGDLNASSTKLQVHFKRHPLFHESFESYEPCCFLRYGGRGSPSSSLLLFSPCTTRLGPAASTQGRRLRLPQLSSPFPQEVANQILANRAKLVR